MKTQRVRSLSLPMIGVFVLTAAAHRAHADEEAYVQIRVPTEIRGVLRSTKDGLVLETRERVQIRSLRPAKIAWEYISCTWELDVRLGDKFKALIRDLDGKTVIVEGVAPLYQIETYSTMGGHHPTASLSWRVERKLTVLTLKAAENSPQSPQMPK